MTRNGRRFRTLTGPASRVRWFVCVARGHRWDVSPKAGVQMMRCVRCGMTAEPFTPS